MSGWFRLHGFGQIWLIKWSVGIINVDFSVPDINDVARETNDSLYIICLPSRIVRKMEDDNVAPFRLFKVIGKSGADNPVAGHNGLFHRTAWNPAVCNNKIVQQKCNNGSCNNYLNPADNLFFPVKWFLWHVFFSFHNVLFFAFFIVMYQSLNEFGKLCKGFHKMVRKYSQSFMKCP